MAQWAVSLKHKHIGIRGGKTITEGGRDDRVTDKLSTGHLSFSRLTHNVLHGATIGSSPTPDTSLSLHMVAISVFYSHTNISLIILMIVTTLFWTGQFQRSLNFQRKSNHACYINMVSSSSQVSSLSLNR